MNNGNQPLQSGTAALAVIAALGGPLVAAILWWMALILASTYSRLHADLPVDTRQFMWIARHGILAAAAALTTLVVAVAWLRRRRTLAAICSGVVGFWALSLCLGVWVLHQPMILCDEAVPEWPKEAAGQHPSGGDAHKPAAGCSG